MLKRCTHFFVYLLLVLLPMQALAAANMLVCNSMMQLETVQPTESMMSCHEATADDTSERNHHPQSAHKSTCASACASMCALTAIPFHTNSSFALNSSQVIDFNHLHYVSITLPNLQRPPITFI
jgi:hypothetical protein